MERYCEYNFFVLCYYFCLELISSGSSIQQNDLLKIIQPFMLYFVVKDPFRFLIFGFFSFTERGAINLRYIFEISIFVQKKKLYKYLYVYKMHIYTHTRLFSIATSLLLLLEKKYQKKKKNE